MRSKPPSAKTTTPSPVSTGNSTDSAHAGRAAPDRATTASQTPTERLSSRAIVDRYWMRSFSGNKMNIASRNSGDSTTSAASTRFNADRSSQRTSSGHSR